MRLLVRAAAFLTLLLALPLSAPAAVPSGRQGSAQAAAVLFARAEEAFVALRASPGAQRQRQSFTRVLEAYRRVFEKHPATRQAELSLMRAGELHTLLYRWTRQEGDLNRAQNYYQRLAQSAPQSPLFDDALLAIAQLYLDQFKDPAQAWLRFRDVIRLSPQGDKAVEAKRQLKRLARYAPAQVPAAAAGGAGSQTTAQSAVCVPAAPPQAATPPPGTKSPLLTPPSPPPTLAAAPGTPARAAGIPLALNRVRGIRHWSNPEYSRVVIDLDQKTNFYTNLLEDTSGSGKSPRLYIDLFSSLVEERFCRPISVNDGILHGIRAGQFTADSVRVVLEIDGLRTFRVFPMQNPFRIVIDVTGESPGAVAGTATGPATVAPVAAAPAPSPTPDSIPAAVPRETAPAAVSAPASLSDRLQPSDPGDRFTPLPVPELIPMPPLTSAQRQPRATTAAPPPRDAAPPPAAFSGSAPGPAPDGTPGAAPFPSATPLPARVPASRAAPARPSSSVKPSLARQLGLGVRRVVIDAGHGAHDPGAIGVGGLQEKEVTLDLALRVSALLQASGYETVLTRDRDVYLPLEERTALANTARGDLFLSLHCNSSDTGTLNGFETYFLNLASSLRSMRTAARENSMAVANMSDLQQIVREIQNSKMDESSQFAARIQRSLRDSLRRKFPDAKDLGVKQAPFYVLIGAQMPSVLAEVSFINHQREGRRLSDPAYRQLIAQALADGVKRYVKMVKTAAIPGTASPTP